MGAPGRSKRDYPGNRWPDNHEWLRCPEAACSAGAAAHHRHEFSRHYTQFHPQATYNFENLIQCTFREHSDHVSHQKSLPGGLARNYIISRRTPARNNNPQPQPFATTQPLASSLPSANPWTLAEYQPFTPSRCSTYISTFAYSQPLATSQLLVTPPPLDTAPPLSVAPPFENWVCMLCDVPTGGVWATIDHAAGHDYTKVNYNAATKTIAALLEDGDTVKETELVLVGDKGRTWVLVGRVE